MSAHNRDVDYLEAVAAGNLAEARKLAAECAEAAGWPPVPDILCAVKFSENWPRAKSENLKARSILRMSRTWPSDFWTTLVRAASMRFG